MVRIPNLTKAQLKRMQNPGLTKRELHRITGEHSDITEKKPLPTPEERIATLETAMEEMKQLVAYIKNQSEDAFAKAFNLEYRVNTILGANGDNNGDK